MLLYIMELAIPALLGGMYILSNQKSNTPTGSSITQGRKLYPNTSNKEGFRTNRVIQKNRNTTLPNSTEQIFNYPIDKQSDLKESSNYYPTSQNATDEYFVQQAYKNVQRNPESGIGKTPVAQKYKALTGETIPTDMVTHNNMVPFFGSKVRQHNTNHESRLDNMIGAGSQHFSKRSQAPLFKPEKNVQWGHGTPNTSNFIQSRMNPATSMNNVKPFQEIRVAPGLGQTGGGVLGNGGFNAGMMERNAWKPKTVDELRTSNNPKVSYNGVVLGGKDRVTNRGIVGKVEKYQPDTYYINTPDRYFTTTGIEKAATVRSKQVMPNVQRATTSAEYYGAGQTAQQEASYVPGAYVAPKRPELDAPIKHISNLNAENRGDANEADYGIEGFRDSRTTNNRDIDNQRERQLGPVESYVKAIFAPLMDVLRPTRKQNVIGNQRQVGNIGSGVTTSNYVYNPANRPRTTIREMTEERPDHYFVGGQEERAGYGYLTEKPRAVGQERDNTTIMYHGNAAGGTVGVTGPTTYNAAYNAQLIDKAPLSQGRTPMGSNVKLYNAQDFTNMKIDRLERDRNNNRMFVPQNLGKINSTQEQFGQYTAKSEANQSRFRDAYNPDNLSAYRNNPYAHSLTSIA